MDRYRGYATAGINLTAVVWSALLVGGLRAEDQRFQPVAKVPGAYQVADGSLPLRAGGKALDPDRVTALAAKADGFDLRVDGVSLFGMEQAHRSGRREPLRPLAADLSDWNKAPACP